MFSASNAGAESRAYRAGAAAAGGKTQPGGAFDLGNRGAFSSQAADPFKTAPVQGPREWKIDNSLLKSQQPGVAYRTSKDLEAKHRSEIAKWGSIITGIDEGDGWVSVVSAAGNLYLPILVRGKPVLSPLRQEPPDDEDIFYVPGQVPTGSTVVLTFCATYIVICGITSFFLDATVLVLCGLLILVQGTIGVELWDFRHPSVLWLVVLWLGTAFGALAVGARNYHASYAPYLTANAGRTYQDVQADAKASDHSDAGLLAFAHDVVSDIGLSVGQRANGFLYCVAPLMSRTQAVNNWDSRKPTKVEFWAVGINCCKPLGDFWCDGGGGVDIGSANANNLLSEQVIGLADQDKQAGKQGVVVHGSAEGTESLTRAIFAPRLFRDGFLRAIRKAVALHPEMAAPDEPVLLRYSANAKRIMNDWLFDAMTVYFVSSAAYIFTAGVVWVVLANQMIRLPWDQQLSPDAEMEEGLARKGMLGSQDDLDQTRRTQRDNLDETRRTRPPQSDVDQTRRTRPTRRKSPACC